MASDCLSSWKTAVPLQRGMRGSIRDQTDFTFHIPSQTCDSIAEHWAELMGFLFSRAAVIALFKMTPYWRAQRSQNSVSMLKDCPLVAKSLNKPFFLTFKQSGWTSCSLVIFLDILPTQNCSNTKLSITARSFTLTIIGIIVGSPSLPSLSLCATSQKCNSETEFKAQ